MPKQMRKTYYNRYSLYLRGKRSEIRLSKSVMFMLNNPSYIRFWWDANERAILVSAAQTGEAAAIAIPDTCYLYKNRVRFSNRRFLNCVNILTGWEDNAYHKLSGKFIPDINMVIFRTENAEAEATRND